MNTQERALKILQAEAWDEGYAAAKEEWYRYNQGLPGGPFENPYDEMTTALRIVINAANRPTKTPRSVIQEVVTYD